MADRIFRPSRMEIARQRRRMTKVDLAATSGISAPTLSKWESGNATPRDENVEKLARALNFPVEFFYGAEAPIVRAENVSFRALSTMPAARRDEVTATAGLAIDLDAWLSERFTRPECDVPNLSHLTPRAAADALRGQWGLGSRPIPNLVHLLEAHGVRIYSIARRTRGTKRRFDGLSTWWEAIPYIFLDVSATPERHRFSCAHELGHLVMHPPGDTTGRAPEREANEFAGRFLVPADDLAAHAPRGLTLSSVSQAKRRWRVAAAALLYRLREDGHIEDWHYRKLVIQLRTHHGDAEPPPQEQTFETSQVLGKVFSLLRAEGVSRRNVAAALQIGLDDLDSMIFAHVPTPARNDALPGRAPRAGLEPGNSPNIQLME